VHSFGCHGKSVSYKILKQYLFFVLSWQSAVVFYVIFSFIK